MQSIFFNHNGMKLESTAEGKFAIQRNIINNQWVKEEITREIRTYLETNGNENTMHQNLWDASLRGKFIPVNAYIKKVKRASLVMQWLRICLPMQGTRV